MVVACVRNESHVRVIRFNCVHQVAIRLAVWIRYTVRRRRSFDHQHTPTVAHRSGCRGSGHCKRRRDGYHGHVTPESSTTHSGGVDFLRLLTADQAFETCGISNLA